MPRKAKGERFISIRVPAGMHRDLTRCAKLDGRSLQKETVHLLAIGMILTEQQRMREGAVPQEAMG